jgi:hypothetical protein
MAANPCVVGWRAEDEYYADKDFGDPDQKLVADGNLPLNSGFLVWCDGAVALRFVTEPSKLGLPGPKEITELVLWRVRGLRVWSNRRGSVDPPKLANASPSKLQLTNWEKS